MNKRVKFSSIVWVTIDDSIDELFIFVVTSFSTVPLQTKTNLITNAYNVSLFAL